MFLLIHSIHSLFYPTCTYHLSTWCQVTDDNLLSCSASHFEPKHIYFLSKTCFAHVISCPFYKPMYGRNKIDVCAMVSYMPRSAFPIWVTSCRFYCFAPVANVLFLASYFWHCFCPVCMQVPMHQSLHYNHRHPGINVYLFVTSCLLLTMYFGSGHGFCSSDKS